MTVYRVVWDRSHYKIQSRSKWGEVKITAKDIDALRKELVKRFVAHESEDYDIQVFIGRRYVGTMYIYKSRVKGRLQSGFDWVVYRDDPKDPMNDPDIVVESHVNPITGKLIYGKHRRV